MAHSAAANERRRELYRAARLLGFEPRDAGHVYSTRTLDRLKTEPASESVRLAPSKADRQETHRRYLEAKRGRAVTLEESREDYLAHNYAKHYTKVDLTLRSTSGETLRRTVTLTSDASLTRGEVYDRVVGYVSKGNRGSPFGPSQKASLDSISIVEETHYREISY